VGKASSRLWLSRKARVTMLTFAVDPPVTYSAAVAFSARAGRAEEAIQGGSCLVEIWPVETASTAPGCS
jgi:hypothetical protein